MAAAQSELVRQVRRALASLNDPAAMRSHPLADLIGLDGAHPRPGANLRQQLLEAIDALPPDRRVDPRERSSRVFRILHLRYVDGVDAVAIQRELGISKSQYYREHEHAIAALSALLLERTPRRTDSAQLPRGHGRPRAPWTSFIGREAERAELRRLLLGNSRLITLLGFGGAGKSRLALQAAVELDDEYMGAVFVVELAPLSEPDLVAQTVAFALGVRETSGEAILETLARAIGSRRVLVVLDNCEHLASVCRQVVDALLRACPRLQMLITSRTLLGIPGEIVWDVAPLTVPDLTLPTTAASISQYEAVQLFAERAALVRPGFRVTDGNARCITQICEAVDGIPLALELAAARIRMLAPDELAQRLQDRFQVLTGGSADGLLQHQTLRALVDWSYELLSETERTLLERLSVFAGGWTLEAAEAVCAGDGIAPADVLDLLTALADKSMVHVEVDSQGGIRYAMLETLRQYAAELLRDRHHLRDVHAQYYRGLVRASERPLEDARQIDTLARLEAEHDNLRAALAHSCSAPALVSGAAELAAVLSYFWFLRNYFSEARQRLLRVLCVVTEATEWTVRCKGAAGFFMASLGEYSAATPMLDEAVADAERLGAPLALAWVAGMQSAAAFLHGHAAEMEAAAHRALAVSRCLDWAMGSAIVAAYIGRARLLRRDVAGAAAWLDTAQSHATRAGDPFTNAMVLSFRGVAATAQGEHARAVECLSESLHLFRKLGNLAHESRILIDLAIAALAAGQTERAAEALLEGATLAERLGTVPYRFTQLLAISAQLVAALGEDVPAARLLGAVRAQRVSTGAELPPDRQAVEEDVAVRLRAHLGHVQFGAALASGEALDQAQATALAVEVLARYRRVEV
jgi:predicted ATPase